MECLFCINHPYIYIYHLCLKLNMKLAIPKLLLVNLYYLLYLLTIIPIFLNFFLAYLNLIKQCFFLNILFISE